MYLLDYLDKDWCIVYEFDLLLVGLVLWVIEEDEKVYVEVVVVLGYVNLDILV